jgi:hypothetical protein
MCTPRIIRLAVSQRPNHTRHTLTIVDGALVARDSWNAQDNMITLQIGGFKQHVGDIGSTDLFYWIKNSLIEMCTAGNCRPDPDKPDSTGSKICCDTKGRWKEGINFVTNGNKTRESGSVLKLEVLKHDLWGSRELPELMFKTVAETYAREVMAMDSQGKRMNCYQQKVDNDQKEPWYCNVGEFVEISANKRSIRTRLTYKHKTIYGSSSCSATKKETFKGLDRYKKDYTVAYNKGLGRGDGLQLQLKCCGDSFQANPNVKDCVEVKP